MKEESIRQRRSAKLCQMRSGKASPRGLEGGSQRERGRVHLMEGKLRNKAMKGGPLRKVAAE